jgi:predicted ATP-grasp superfamily ATP-dependent carboligase
VNDDLLGRGSVDARVPAVVFRLNANPLQHASLAIARSLGRLGVPVYFATVDARTPALRSRYSRGQPVRLAPAQRPVLESLLEVSERVGGSPVLISPDDVAALFVDEHADELRTGFRFPDQPRGLPERLSNKGGLHRLAQSADIPTPAARFPASREEFVANVEELGLPVVVKSMDPSVLRRRPGAASVAVARTLDEATRVYDAGEDPAQPNFMLQEYIPGDARSIWMFNGYFDAAGTCRFGVVGQKIRQSPPRTGATSLGVVVDNDEVLKLTTRFLSHVGYRGIVDLGFRRDERDGRYKLLDVNPRIGSSFRLFVGRNGLDVARALYLDMTGQGIPKTTPRVGRKWLAEDQDLSTFRLLARARELGLREYVGSLRGVEETAWLSRDDPWPALDVLVKTVAPILRRAPGSRGNRAVRRAAPGAG